MITLRNWLIIAINLFPMLSIAQAGDWTWINGMNYAGANATFGTQGLPDPANTPAGLYEPCQWTDTNGNFWLFGGLNSSSGYNNTLWKFNPLTDEWTWMKGPSASFDPGNYGTQGVESDTSLPPARCNGMATWTDKNNNLWMFGGVIQSTPLSSFNDLWRYNISTNNWTWMKGADTTNHTGLYNTAVYGTQGVPNISNNPPSRAETAATWVDDNGDLWLFGGQSYRGVFNDLWRYTIATNTWTWMKGSNSLNKASVYGTKTIENPANTPAGRGVYSHLIDAHNNLWLFGGFIAGSSSYVLMNDIWRFNPTTNNWAWIGGNKSSGQKSYYQTKCVADSNNVPGARYENRACWTDKNGNLWFFGGFMNSASTPDVSNELWMYCISSNKWIFVNGDTAVNSGGNFGNEYIPDPANEPPAAAGSVSWFDKDSNSLYLFGGVSQGIPNSYNCMWKYDIDTNCTVCAAAILPVAAFQASDTTICENQCINFINLSTNSTSWLWTFTGASQDTSTMENPQTICYFNQGVYDATLIATSENGSDSVRRHLYIHVAPPMVQPGITLSGSNTGKDTLTCSTDPSYVSYQWYFGNTLLVGQTNPVLIPKDGSGNYNCSVTNKDSCSIAVGINVVGIKEFSAYDLQFTVSPNPAGNELTITGNSKPEIGNWELGIYNVVGQEVYNRQLLRVSNLRSQTIDISALASGVYFINIYNERGRWIGKFVKE